jgi:ribonuclease P protein component
LSAQLPSKAKYPVNAVSREAKPERVALRFPKSARLLKHSDFQHVYKNGKRHFSGPLTAFYVVRGDSEGPRIGLTVGKAVGGSVERNRIKRRMREAVRMHLPELSAAVDLVFNPKKAVLSADFTQIAQEVRRAFEVVQKNAERRSKDI